MIDASIAFVILTWNSERYVDACLQSVLALDARTVAVHVVDNGSQDSTVCRLDSFSHADDRVHVYKQGRNLGTTVGRNLALRQIGSCDYVCILDSDTVVNQPAFERLCGCLRDDAAIGVIGPTLHDSQGVTQLSGRCLPTIQIKLGKIVPIGGVRRLAERLEVPTSETVDGLQDVGYLLSACWLMPFSTIDKVGYLDENIFYAPEDVDFCLRAHARGLRVVQCHDVSIVHEYQRISRQRIISSTNASHLCGLAYYFKKHRYLFRAPRY